MLASLFELDFEDSSDDSDFTIDKQTKENNDSSSDSEESTDDTSETDSDYSKKKSVKEEVIKREIEMRETDSNNSKDKKLEMLEMDLEESENLSAKENNKIFAKEEFYVRDVIQQACNRMKDNKLRIANKDNKKILICCVCLGERSDETNEIVECDNCNVTVHEGCYGVSDTTSIDSSGSNYSTEPWFCEPCRAGVVKPTCELCPNSGGIYKKTDVGKWVHTVCALYVSGVTFGDVAKLSSITLFEIPHNKWGTRTCFLCEDERVARTGVCIGCDAGMCRTYFHVTCAQREGFLSEIQLEEVNQADPFYAHCKMHSDKTLVTHRKRNWLALQHRTQERRIECEQKGYNKTPEQLRIQRKLEIHRQSDSKTIKSTVSVRTENPSTFTMKKAPKAEPMDADSRAFEMQKMQIAALKNIRKKWHISPSFNVEYTAYYSDRNNRLSEMKTNLQKSLNVNAKLLGEQQALFLKHEKLMKASAHESLINNTLKQIILKYHTVISTVCPEKNLPAINELGKRTQKIMGPTARDGIPLGNITEDRLDTQDNLLLNECGICKQRQNQHLLTQCDTCHSHYHIKCLDPPLSNLPKKSKIYGWQCSRCDKSSDSELDIKDTGSRRTRFQRNKEETALQPEILTSKVKIEPFQSSPNQKTTYISDVTNSSQHSNYLDKQTEIIENSNKKRRQRKISSKYSPDHWIHSKEKKRKIKKKSMDTECSNITLSTSASKSLGNQNDINLHSDKNDIYGRSDKNDISVRSDKNDISVRSDKSDSNLCSEKNVINVQFHKNVHSNKNEVKMCSDKIEINVSSDKKEIMHSDKKRPLKLPSRYSPDIYIPSRRRK